MPSFSIGFYNTENFFDFHDNLHNHDRDFTPTGSKKWTENRYWIKVKRIGQVISQLGVEETGNPPLFMGLAEVENAKVLTDLINSEHLKEYAYGFIHFDSLDERGMDTAMLYRKNLISPEYIEPLRFVFPETGIPTDFTRDVLYVRLKFRESLIHSFVMHLPSRRDVDVNRDFRILIMEKIRQKVDEILSHDPNAYIILMGDMNGNPEDKDAVDILKVRDAYPMEPQELYNPMFQLRKSTGSLLHDGNWILFDQILFSHSFLQPGGLLWKRADVYKSKMLQDWNVKFSGLPFRTYAGNKYLGGYSDHFPVYAILNH